MNDSDSGAPLAGPARTKQIVSSLMALRPRPKQAIELFAADAQWSLNGDPAKWAFAGLRAGRDSILAFLQAFTVEFEQLDLRVLSLVIDDDQACVQYEQRVRHRGTRREDVVAGLCFVRLQGERIAEVNELIDSERLFSLRESRF